MMDKIFYAKNLEETRKLIDEKIQDGDLLLIMTAGDMYKIADEMINK
jgi:UDP-N-acetylmuramate-alanine ligase